MFRRYFLAICFCLVCKSSTSQTPWSLQACIDYAVKNNLSVTQADLQARLSALTVSETKASLLPSLNFSGNSGYRFGLTENPTTGVLQSSNFLSAGFSLSTGITLFNWFSRQHTLKAAQLDEKANRMAVRKAEDDIVLNVSAAYLQALLSKEMVVATLLQLQQTKAQAEVTRKKIAMGILSELDAAQVQLQLMADSAALLSADESKEKALLQLKTVLSLDAASGFDIAPLPEKDTAADRPFGVELASLLENAFQNQPQFLQTAYQMEASVQRIKAARAGKYPSVSLYGTAGSNFVNLSSAQEYTYISAQTTGARVEVNGRSYDVTAPSFKATSFGVTPFFTQLHKNFGQSIGLSLSVPLFNGKSLLTNQKRETINFFQLKLQREKLHQEWKTAIYTTYVEAMAAWKKLRLHQTMVTTAAKVWVAAQKRYGLNLLSTQDLLISQTFLQKARTELNVALYEFLFRKKVLEFYSALCH